MTTYYKVLRDGMSCHGGTFDWTDYLPKGKRPGKWTPAVSDVRACSRGYHGCTAEQLGDWFSGGNQVWECEYRDTPTDHGDKVVGAQMRLLRRVGHGGVVGDITIAFERPVLIAASGRCFALGSATVEASGSATVRASGSATVRASGSATVEAWDSATVRASGSATVRALGSATVEASGSAVLVDRTGRNIVVSAAAEISVVKEES